jgi:hypothetical protein
MELLPVVERVSALLRDSPGLMSCLTCLAIDAHVPRDGAQETTQHLLCPGTGYRLTNGVCGRCGLLRSFCTFRRGGPGPRSRLADATEPRNWPRESIPGVHVAILLTEPKPSLTHERPLGIAERTGQAIAAVRPLHTCAGSSTGFRQAISRLVPRSV